MATVTRAGVGAFQSSGMLLSRYERRAQLMIGGGLVGFSMLAARYPRVVAWPLACVAGGVGASLLQRATRTLEKNRRPLQPAILAS